MEIPMKAELEREFRKKAMQTKGYRRGAFKEALEEAIEDWLKKIASQDNKKRGKKEKMEMEKAEMEIRVIDRMPGV